MKRWTLVLALGLFTVTACDDLAEPDSPMLSVNTPTGEDLRLGNAKVFPSTNEANYQKTPTPWAHVLFVDVAVGQVTLNFVSARALWSCFEYRIDDEAYTEGPDNRNPAITDGLWKFMCLQGDHLKQTFLAKGYVDVRMGFGDDGDERFDWTRFYVLSLENKDQCKDGQWQAWGFANQGLCVRFVETGKDSRIGG